MILRFTSIKVPENIGTTLIVGGTGSLGKTLIRRLRGHCDLHIASRDESKHWSIRSEMSLDKSVHFHVADIRDPERMKQIIRNVRPDTVIIAAALKQVDTCELSPDESIKTNLLGTTNVLRAIEETDSVSRVLFVSTDKAANPINVYGMCKATSERLTTSRAALESKTIHLCTRYGNVLESRGSIIPLFKKQIEMNKPITITDPDMTRFVMTLDQSVDLIFQALTEGHDGETWIPKLNCMRIGDLADIFSEVHNVATKKIDVRPGEKKHEELITPTEWSRLKSEWPGHYVFGPSYDTTKSTKTPFERDISKSFSSNDEKYLLTKDELKSYLEELNVLYRPSDAYEGLSVEEIKIK